VMDDAARDKTEALPTRLTREIAQAYDDARIRGLCDSGALEVAAERVRHAEATMAADLLRQGLRFNNEVARSLFAVIPADRATEQPDGVVNHPAWTLAHLCHYQPATLALAGGQSVRDPAQLPDAHRYDAGSTPIRDKAAYPAWAELTARYKQAHDEILQSLESITHQTLVQRPGLGRWAHTFADTASALQYLLVHHEAIHLGQMMVWCRVMGVLATQSNA